MDTIINLLLPSNLIKLSNKEDSNLKTILQILCVNVAMRAFENYLEGNLNQFDPMVGDNACQIRAIQLQDILTNNAISKDHLTNSIDKMVRLKEAILNQSLPDPEDRIEAFSKEEKFLINAYMLTYMIRKKDNILINDESRLNDFCKPFSLISEENQLFNEPAYDILKDISVKAKTTLSKDSVSYMQNIGKQALKVLRNMPLKLREEHHLNKSLYEYYFVSKALDQTKNVNGLGLMSTPMLYNVIAVLNYMKLKGRLLILNLGNQEHLAFKSNEKGVFEKIEDLNMFAEDPAIIIQLNINDNAPIEKVDLILNKLRDNEEDFVSKFIIANAADHPFYSGKYKGCSLKYFEDKTLLPFLKCKEDSLDKIESKLNEDFSRKELNSLNSRFNPFTLPEVIMEYRKFQKLQVEGEEIKKSVKVQHFYCNTLKSLQRNEITILEIINNNSLGYRER